MRGYWDRYLLVVAALVCLVSHGVTYALGEYWSIASLVGDLIFLISLWWLATGYLGAFTSAAAMSLFTGVLFSIHAYTTVSCPLNPDSVCTTTEVGVWALTGVLVAISIFFTLAGVYLIANLTYRGALLTRKMLTKNKTE